MNDTFLEAQALEKIAATNTLAELDQLRVSLIGKKGQLTAQMKALGGMSPEERRQAGARLNVTKDHLLAALQARKDMLEADVLSQRLAQEHVDVTLPLPQNRITEGRVHPVNIALYEAKQVFRTLGFDIADGPEIETEAYNFTALNVPPGHPVRAEQDTFYIQDPHEKASTHEAAEDAQHLLRTHTSPVQIRTLEKRKPPLRIISPGRVYRADYDATHTPMFHQIEGLVIEPGTHMGHLKWCLEAFLEGFFGRPVPTRFRPSYFPFTEPSAEVDILCDRSKKGLVVGEGTEWLEVLGCGMVHPYVLKNMGLDADTHQGFAFGMGVERLAMLKYGISDLRCFFENGCRWLSHYGRPATHMTAAG